MNEHTFLELFDNLVSKYVAFCGSVLTSLILHQIKHNRHVFNRSVGFSLVFGGTWWCRKSAVNPSDSIIHNHDGLLRADFGLDRNANRL